MARKIGGVTVLTRKGKLKVGTLLSVVFGVPVYAFARGTVEFVALPFAGLSTAITNVSGWYDRFISVGLSNPVAGFKMADAAFAGAIGSYGLVAFVVSIVIATATMWILIEGVTRVR